MAISRDDTRRNLSVNCTKCCAPMRLVAIEPEGDAPPSRQSPKLEAHYFECVNCGQKRTYPLSKSG